MPNARDRLLQQAHETRVKAVQARNLSGHVARKSVFDELVAYARELDAQAAELERQANEKAPVVTTHRTPVQVQQAQVEQKKDGPA